MQKELGRRRRRNTSPSSKARCREDSGTFESWLDDSNPLKVYVAEESPNTCAAPRSALSRDEEEQGHHGCSTSRLSETGRRHQTGRELSWPKPVAPSSAMTRNTARRRIRSNALRFMPLRCVSLRIRPRTNRCASNRRCRATWEGWSDWHGDWCRRQCAVLVSISLDGHPSATGKGRLCVFCSHGGALPRYWLNQCCPPAAPEARLFIGIFPMFVGKPPNRRSIYPCRRRAAIGR